MARGQYPNFSRAKHVNAVERRIAKRGQGWSATNPGTKTTGQGLGSYNPTGNKTNSYNTSLGKTNAPNETVAENISANRQYARKNRADLKTMKYR